MLLALDASHVCDAFVTPNSRGKSSNPTVIEYPSSPLYPSGMIHMRGEGAPSHSTDLATTVSLSKYCGLSVMHEPLVVDSSMTLYG